MGGRKCIVPDCASTATRQEDRGVTFHKIPANRAVAKQWVISCHLPEGFSLDKISNVCSRHFRKADFQTFKGKKYVLKFGAVPSIFPWTARSAGSSPETQGPLEIETASAPNKVSKSDKKDEQPDNCKHEVGDDDGDTAPGKESTEPQAAAVVVPTPQNPPTNAARSKNSGKLKRKPAIQRTGSARRFVASSSRKKPRRVSKAAAAVSSPRKQTSKKASMARKSSSPDVASADVLPSGGGAEKLTSFTPGTKIEAQDFSGRWHTASLLEVDTEEREVLVQFDKTDTSKTILNDEWIPMDSVRLRPLTQHGTFSMGDRVFARWSDSRKFKATIKGVLENDMYEVMFEDGFAKICKSQHISRIKRPLDTSIRQEPEATDKSFPVPMVTVKVEATEGDEPAPLMSLAQFQIPQVMTLSELPEIPQQGEWCCHWYNDYPVGESAELNVIGGKICSVVVPDWRLPEGWTKHIYQRVTAFGRMEVVLVNPNGKPLRSRQEVKQYLAETGGTYDTATYDFGLHKRRAKDLGFYQYTQAYKDAFFSKPVPVPELTNTEINIGSVRVKVIDNLLQCPEPDCLKTFRKENHLQIHIKHYHKELAKGLGEIPNMQDLATLRTPVESLDTPIKIVRRSAAGALKTPSAAIKEDRKDEALQIKREPGSEVKDETKLAADLHRLTGVAIKQEQDHSNEAAAGFMGDVSMLKSEPFTGADQTGKGTPGSASGSTSASNKSRTQSKLAKIKLFPLKKERRSSSNKVRRGIVQKRASAKRDNKRAKQVAQRSFLNRPLLPPEEPESGGYSYGAGGGSELGGSFYDDSINASSSLGMGGSLVDDNGEAIKIVRMRKEEIINCVCKFTEEDGLMVQCDICLCWQHGVCQNFFKDTEVPDTYVCSICRNPYRVRPSKRYVHDQDWLYEGKLPVARYHAANSRHAQRFDILKNAHTLNGNLMELKRFMHSLQVKINIAERKDHPKMYLWSKKWEKSPPRAGDAGEKLHTAEGGTAEQKQMPQVPVPEAPIDPAECQAILLDHIQKQQNDASGRLQAIEAQIIGLEAYDEKADLLESPTAKNYPKTKQTIHMLLNDLMQLKKIAAIHTEFNELAQETKPQAE
ncbi:uncharacterized protein LOC131216394 [Anopheles bellator]|uniref:uncharacterized protein LOC131216394 n=1 Tax=Anopheles bellator TaxID=139047 RepID=UPI0026485BA3|nr:uncharacterized protein LOC131216394 [Anopheles bellator]